MAGNALMQIGEVAERTGLSLRTIRYYEEVGLVVPSARSQGGFRLYTTDDVNRLQTVRRMKPLDLSLEQMRELLEVIDRLSVGDLPTGGNRTGCWASCGSTRRRFGTAARRCGRNWPPYRISRRY